MSIVIAHHVLRLRFFSIFTGEVFLLFGQTELFSILLRDESAYLRLSECSFNGVMSFADFSLNRLAMGGLAFFFPRGELSTLRNGGLVTSSLVAASVYSKV